MAFLVFQCGGHEEGEDLIKERASSEVSGLVSQLTQRTLPLGWGSVLDLQEHLHDLPLLCLFHTQLLVLDLSEKISGSGKLTAEVS